MTDDRELKQDNTAYTAPAEDSGYQFCSGLNSLSEETKPRRVKNHNAIGLVITGILILLAASVAVCVLVLQLTLSVRQDENGFSIELVRRSNSKPIVRLEEPLFPRVQPGSS